MVYADFTNLLLGEDAHASYMLLPRVAELGNALQAVLESHRGPHNTDNFEFANNVCRNAIYHIQEAFDPRRQNDKDWKSAREDLDTWLSGLMKKVRKSDGTEASVRRFTDEDLNRIKPQDKMVYCILRVFRPYCKGALNVAAIYSLLEVDIDDDADSSLQKSLWSAAAVEGTERDAMLARARSLLEKWGRDVGILLAYRNACGKNAADRARDLSAESGDHRFADLVEEFAATVPRSAGPLLGDDFNAEDLERRVGGGDRHVARFGTRKRISKGAVVPAVDPVSVLDSDAAPSTPINRPVSAVAEIDTPPRSEARASTAPRFVKSEDPDQRGSQPPTRMGSSWDSLPCGLAALNLDEMDDYTNQSSLGASMAEEKEQAGHAMPESGADGGGVSALSSEALDKIGSQSAFCGTALRKERVDALFRDRVPAGYTGDRDEAGRAHGFGTFLGPCGTRELRGHWVHGEFVWGISEYPDGEVYEGEFKDGQPHGCGKYMLACGGVYEGELKDNQPHGRGKHMFADGGVYEGEWKDSKCHGRGRCMFAGGDVYEGEWKDGQPHGHGKFMSAGGSVYEGEWKDDKRHGRGKYMSADGGVYEGEWKDGQSHGHGKYMSAAGDVSEGEYKDGKRHGRGKVMFADGDVYEGEYKDDKPHGRGKYMFADGDVYEGEFEDDNPHGHGKFTITGVSVYEGGFQFGQQHGPGKITFASGEVFELDHIRHERCHVILQFRSNK